MRESKDRLQRRSILEYLDRKIANAPTDSARVALEQTREWVRRWRPRASTRKGGLGR